MPTVSGHPTQLMRLFQNLIGNAIKYRASDREPLIEIGAEPDTDGWRFWVRDNGIGIKKQHYAKIFQRGERLHTDRDIPGFGWGLAICEKIVQRRGGCIGVDSEVGVGSTFFFTWPAVATK
jgi:signal transduction histidine kinase